MSTCGVSLASSAAGTVWANPIWHSGQFGSVARSSSLPLWEHLQAHGVSRDFIGRLARLVRRMHVRGVYHRDLKANNILARGDDLWVIDLDRVDFMLSVDRPERVLNLAQLNGAIGAPATRTDRLRGCRHACLVIKGHGAAGVYGPHTGNDN